MVPRFPQLAFGTQGIHLFILRVNIAQDQQAFPDSAT